ncbi:MAG: peptidylprolyl isomerase, partial [Xanthomonadales bacterium]|nr:peptidylprolyl isomerase [Xanthomonadales bacterium]
LAEAGRQGIDGSGRATGETPEDAQIRKLIELNIEVAAPPGESECLRYYHANPGAMRADDQHEVSHILIPAPPGDAEIRAAAREKTVDLLQTLRAKPGRFAELAREFSRCPSAAEGGHLGLIGRGQTVPEFEAALSRLPVGEVPDYPLETRFGFHVVMIHQRRSGGPLSFGSCRKKIADYLRENARRQAIREYIGSLPQHHRVQGIDLQAAAGAPAC